MKKAMYILPAALVCLVYGFLTILAGGIGGYQLGAWLNIGLPVASAITLSRGWPWGCIPGMALGAYFLWVDTSPILGIAVIVYYGIAGWICKKS